MSTVFVLDSSFSHCVETLTRRTIWLSNNTSAVWTHSCSSCQKLKYFDLSTKEALSTVRNVQQCLFVLNTIRKPAHSVKLGSQWTERQFLLLAKERSPWGMLYPQYIPPHPIHTPTVQTHRDY